LRKRPPKRFLQRGVVEFVTRITHACAT
jgi:hypothetical protein